MRSTNSHPDHDVTDDNAAEAGMDAPEMDGAVNDELHTDTPDATGNGTTVNAEAINDVEDVETEEGQDDVMMQLEQTQAKADEYLDSWQRERATFQNYKKRIERERTEQSKAIAGNLLLKLLPVLDDFYRAMDAVPQAEQNEWFGGMALILKKLERYLADQGVSEIDALGEQFDPNFHEAIGVDGESDAESGTITQVMLRGYMHGDRVLRPSMVRVAG